MVLHTPWNRNLGAASVQMELADHLTAMGHSVDHLSADQLVRRGDASRIGRLVGPSFGTRAVPVVRRRADAYDVIDAHQGNLPVPKRDLGFRGLLVTRSSGLVPFYADFARSIRARWPDEPRGNRFAERLRERSSRAFEQDTRRTFEHADLINVPNADEAAWLTEEGYGDKTVVIHNGIPDWLLDETPGEPDAPEVSVIGSWDVRKGKRDWPGIIDAVRNDVPDARFVFLGTGRSTEDVGRDLGADRMKAVKVIASYRPRDLPDLIRGSSVGALPTYIEGFGIGLVEQMAMGVPSVAYDVPGPRETLGRLDATLLVEPGRPDRLAAEVVRVLRMPREERRALQDRARRLASTFAWGRIAQQTLSTYQAALDSLDGTSR
jgi:glycosyltransferase involved in cell wall biosynthesis